MAGTRPFLQAFNYHSYPARHCENHTLYYERMFSASWLRQSVWLQDLHANASECWRQWEAQGLRQAGVALQLTETNSCYDMAGPDMVGFANAFFYVASIGQTAAAGLRMHSRWNLYGQHFGFLQPPVLTTSPHTAPQLSAGHAQGVQPVTAGAAEASGPFPAAVDFWISVLFKRTAGCRVLQAGATVPGEQPESVPVLAYAYCAGGG